jgi:hypothetical protein
MTKKNVFAEMQILKFDKDFPFVIEEDLKLASHLKFNDLSNNYS